MLFVMFRIVISVPLSEVIELEWCFFRFSLFFQCVNYDSEFIVEFSSKLNWTLPYIAKLPTRISFSIILKLLVGVC